MKFEILTAALLSGLTSARVVSRQEDPSTATEEWIVTVPKSTAVNDILAQAHSFLRSAESLTAERTHEFDGFHGLTIRTSESILDGLRSQGLVEKYQRNAEGININHVDFEGRAYHGANFSSDFTPEDRDGHGTSVAGLAGGRQWGVAKAATLINVKITDGLSGTVADILSGLEWTANDAKAENRSGRAVANLSIGTFRSEILNDAVTALVDAGVFVTVAAGNSNQDANDYSPGTAERVCNIACSNSTDGRSSFSNWGTEIDLFAPGSAVGSPSHTSNTGTRVTSGTSEAAPQVAGLAAYLIGLEGPTVGNALCDRMKVLATRDVIVDPRGSPNLLVYNGIV